ncbi:hypothetical protein ACQ4PT_004501 [Festuca glaucescens]
MVAGVCYGMVGNNLPSRSDVVRLYRSKGITGMRLYSPDAHALSALRNSGISLMIDVRGTDRPALLPCRQRLQRVRLGPNQRAGLPWPDHQVHRRRQLGPGRPHAENRRPSHPEPQRQAVPLSASASVASRFPPPCGSTLVANSYPPSSGVFAQSYMADVSRLLSSTGAPLLANLYPYIFAMVNENFKLDRGTPGCRSSTTDDMDCWAAAGTRDEPTPSSW